MDTNDFFYDDSCKNNCCCKCKHLYFIKNHITLEHNGYICAAPVYFNINEGENNTDVYSMKHPHGECEMFDERSTITKRRLFKKL